MILWFFGRPGSGKTTIAKIFAEKYNYLVIDNDTFRKKARCERGFSISDRMLNIIDALDLAKSMSEYNAIFSFVTPFEVAREMIKVEIKNCQMIYINCSLHKCIKRDPKGMYKKALDGEIKNFTGIDSKFEKPETVDLVLDTEENAIDKCVDQLADYIKGLQ